MHTTSQHPNILLMVDQMRTPPWFPAGAALVDLAGVRSAPAHLPGRSLAPIIRGALTASVHEHVILSWNMTVRRAGGGPLTGDPARMPAVPGEMRAIFDGRYKFARYFDDGIAEQDFELYDLHNDPLELANLAADPGYAALRRAMADRLRAAEASGMAPIDLAAVGSAE